MAGVEEGRGEWPWENGEASPIFICKKLLLLFMALASENLGGDNVGHRVVILLLRICQEGSLRYSDKMRGCFGHLDKLLFHSSTVPTIYFKRLMART